MRISNRALWVKSSSLVAAPMARPKVPGAARARRAVSNRLKGALWHLRRAARRVHVLPYRTEQWTVEEWQTAYRSERFDYFSSLPELPRYSILIGYLKRFAEGRDILDVGCGRGPLRQQLDGFAFGSYTGIDLSAAAIGDAEHLADNRTTFVCGDVTTLALPSVDVVVLNEVLYVTPDPSKMLDALERALTPGGLILTSMWCHPGDTTLRRLLIIATPWWMRRPSRTRPTRSPSEAFD